MSGAGAAAPASFQRRAMGSPLRLTIVGLPEARSAAGWEALSAVVEEIEEALSRFRPTSGLTALNARAGDPTCSPVDGWLAAALAAADRAHRVTGGAFDPRVLRDLERLGYAGALIASSAADVGGDAPVASSAAPSAEPDPAAAAVSQATLMGDVALSAAPVGAGASIVGPSAASVTAGGSGAALIGDAGPRAAPGMPGGAGADGRAAFADGRWLRLDPRRRQATVAAPVDLGGIGKGLALRWAMRVLEHALPELADPATGALLEAGGDIVARGTAPQEGPWMIGVENPGGGDDVAVVTLRDGAICTSSIAVHRWRTGAGREVHHLLDPRTGEPGGAGLLAVTVAGPDPAWAEVWSKTLFLEGASGIAARARRLGLAAWWILDDGALEMTPAARVQTAWLASEA
jgi:FAD:protein FMN transferase